MKKKLVLTLLIAALMAGRAFAQEEQKQEEQKQEELKHQPFDVLVGLNFGLGISPNMFGLFESITKGQIPQGNYALIFDFGITGDFYVFNWLSVNTGLLLHPDIYVLLNKELSGEFELSDIAATPFV